MSLDFGPGALRRTWRRGRLAEAAAIVISHMHTRRHGHLTGEQAGIVAQRAGVGRLVLTHTGPWPGRNAENLRRAREPFAGGVEQASEGAVYTTQTLNPPMTRRLRSWRR